MPVAASFDLLVTVGRVVCPASGFDAAGSVVIRDGRLVAVGPSISGNANRSVDFPDAILLPGLIDLHAHPAKAGSVFGVDPDDHLLARGTTTVLSQGDAGAANIDDYVHRTIEKSQTRIRLAINLSSVGESTTRGCFEQLEWVDVDACVAAVARHRAHIWGIAVNTSRNACGKTDPRKVLRRGLHVADEVGLPLLYGMRPPEEWSFAEQMQQLRPGDVVTYCFRRKPHCIVEDGRVHPAIREARDRGILFDVGHGTASFDFAVAEAAMADGCAPDTISTDLQVAHLAGESPHDLPLVMSKMLAAGMPERDVFTAVTSRPAEVLGLSGEIGSLQPGMCADVTLLSVDDTGEPLRDASGQHRSGRQWTTALTIRNGRIIENE